MDNSVVIVGGAVAASGAAVLIWAKAIVSLNRNQVSKFFQKRYWQIWSDLGFVRFIGISTIVVGALFALNGLLGLRR